MRFLATAFQTHLVKLAPPTTVCQFKKLQHQLSFTVSTTGISRLRGILGKNSPKARINLSCKICSSTSEMELETSSMSVGGFSTTALSFLYTLSLEISQISGSLIQDSSVLFDRFLMHLFENDLDISTISLPEAPSFSSSLSSSSSLLLLLSSASTSGLHFCESAIRVAHSLCLFSNSGNKSKETWNALQRASAMLLDGHEPYPASTALSLITILSVLALHVDTSADSSRAASSAVGLVVSRSSWQKEAMEMVDQVTRCLLDVVASCRDDEIDLHIVTCLWRSFQIPNTEVSTKAATLVARILNRIGTQGVGSSKQKVMGALALSSEIGAWSTLSPVTLVEMATSYDLWHAAELICTSAQRHQSTEMCLAVQRLVDLALEARIYRQADKFATKFVDIGGKLRLVEARMLHAQSTITKVVKKNQTSLIERVVESVDKAVAIVMNTSDRNHVEELSSGISSDAVSCVDINKGTDFVKDVRGASEEIRNFALGHLEIMNEIDAVTRLAKIWDIPYEQNEETRLAAIASRRKKYLQWDEAISGTRASSPPEVLSTAEDLYREFKRLGWMEQDLVKNMDSSLDSISKNPESKALDCSISGANPDRIYGFDAEWGEDDAGVALLQIATTSDALLVDIPALCNTEEGIQALKETVGVLFSSSRSIVVGFACRQDISRLKSSPCLRISPSEGIPQHWLEGTEAVVDVKKIIAEKSPDLVRYGLSTLCQIYFGKPLDKAEQCSMWNVRPLTKEQRIYAALDAWACATIYKKLMENNENSTTN